jgi:hypothetical protein
MQSNDRHSPLLLISKKHKATGSGTCNPQSMEPTLDASHKGTPNIPVFPTVSF